MRCRRIYAIIPNYKDFSIDNTIYSVIYYINTLYKEVKKLKAF